jgi:hypothetical protein
MSTPSPAAEPVKGPELCHFCGSQVRRYYRVGSNIGCVECTEGVRWSLKNNPSRYFARTLVVGIATSFFCAVAYGLLLIGAQISFGAVFIGGIVASAMMGASKGTGGIRYRLTAVALTYLAGSLPWGFFLYDKGVPIWVELVAGFLSPIYRIQGGQGSVTSVIFLAIGMFLAWRIAGGTPAPGIYGPFGEKETLPS